jgi:hypothetical protein
MRSRWEEREADRSDDPVTLTESQLRSLKRGAAIGIFAMILAVVAAGVAGYSLVSARNINADFVAASKPAEAAAPAMAPDTAATASAPAPAAPASAVQPPAAPAAAPAVQPATATAPRTAAAKHAPSVKTDRAASRKATARAQSAMGAGIEERPVTIPAAAPDPTPATTIARPQPVAAEPAKPKPAAHDSSAAH